MSAPSPIRAFVVAGLGFGDEGKGATVDWLVRRHGASTVVRYNGGPQAAHHVATDDGRVHCASQLGAGVLVPGVRAHLAGTVVVDPPALLAEDEALRSIGVEDGLARLTVDPRSVIVTPMHATMNRLLELARGAGRHGSCGRGVGQALLDAERGNAAVLRAGDLADPRRVRSIVRDIRLSRLDRADQLCDDRPGATDLRACRDGLADPRSDEAVTESLCAAARRIAIRTPSAAELGPVVVLEGAQGLLLDRDLGFWPHVTPSSTTFVHAERFLGQLEVGLDVVKVGVLRAYATRHGAGPLATEDEALTAALPEAHNRTDPWQGRFRLGWFDAPMARYALRAIGGVDALVVTHLDRLASLERAQVCPAYENARDVPSDLRKEALTAWWKAAVPRLAPVRADAFRAWLDAELGLPIAAVGQGPTAGDFRLRSDAVI
jgi:adenylosuccinate synthase